MDMRKVIDVYAAATEHVDQSLSLTLFMRSDIPKGLYEWKTENKQTTRDLSILRTTPLTRESSLSTTSVPLQMMVEKLARTNVKVVSSNPLS